MKTVNLPLNASSSDEIQTEQSVLIVGSNGSGKTRLGAWIEINSPQKALVHRISAQKLLNMPDSSVPQSIEKAKNTLLFGHENYTHENKLSKWNNKPATQVQSDFDKLMVFLFSDETEENAKFKVECKKATNRIEPPVTKLDEVKALWEEILPHRELLIGGLRIQTCLKGQNTNLYSSSEMSDGERVIFYLIGQCLAAPENGIIVIDEPELHLHKSVQIPLWAAIEKSRHDCTFIYLTHDVNFASSKESSSKIWLKSFDGQSWQWEEINHDENIPEELLIEILGSRKPVLFVEGTNGSHDVSLYRELLPNFLIIPSGSCSQVIQSVKAFKSNSQAHHLDVYGLIDRDRRLDNEIVQLEQSSIFTLNVAEVENLFCTKEVLKIVSEHLERDPVADFNSISNYIFGQLNSELQHQIALHVKSEIKFQLSLFDANCRNVDEIDQDLTAFVQEIPVAEIYSNVNDKFNQTIQSHDYQQLLKIYNRKSIASQICNQLGLSNGSLQDLIVRLSRNSHRDLIANALKPYFGNFGVHLD